MTRLETRMSDPARTVLAFGWYILILGAVLVLAPNLLLTAFGLPPTEEVWIRVVGMLLLFLGGYYQLAARAEWTPFFRASVWFRGLVIVFFAAFVLLGFVKPALLGFAVVDLLAALWTATALRHAAGRG
jgi:hypothetical protein